MNDRIPPHVEKQVIEINEYQANRKQKAENKSFIENMLSPNLCSDRCSFVGSIPVEYEEKED